MGDRSAYLPPSGLGDGAGVCGTLGGELGWHYGFAAAGIGMLIGTAIYILGLRHLPPDELHRTRAEQRGLIVTLNGGILFDTGKTALKPGAKSMLSKIAKQLQTDPSLKIAVEGHTDSVGGAATNQSLSEKRANAVRDYLVSAGISGDHITADGKGEESPIATNKTAAGRQQNRRVELVITQ